MARGEQIRYGLFRCGPMVGSQSAASDFLRPPRMAFVGGLLSRVARRGLRATQPTTFPTRFCPLPPYERRTRPTCPAVDVSRVAVQGGNASGAHRSGKSASS